MKTAKQIICHLESLLGFCEIEKRSNKCLDQTIEYLKYVINWIENDSADGKFIGWPEEEQACHSVKCDKYRIVRNSAICKYCAQEIESKHVHDFVNCKCGRIAVDGGKDYLKRCFLSEEDYIETSITEKIEDEA